MTTLTYGDLAYIRDALVERRKATLARAQVGDREISDTLMRDWNNMGNTLGKVETMIEQTYTPLTNLNEETIAAINEPIEGRPVAHSIEELLEALKADE